MAPSAFGSPEFRQLLKDALSETLHEQRELLYEVFVDVFEDFGLIEVIGEGQKSERVGRDEICGIFATYA